MTMPGPRPASASACARADAGAPGSLPWGIVRSREPCSTFRMDSCDGFIGTFSGVRFWPLLPNPDDIVICRHCPRAGAPVPVWRPRLEVLQRRRALRPRQPIMSARARPLGPATRRQRSLLG